MDLLCLARPCERMVQEEGLTGAYYNHCYCYCYYFH